MSITGNRYGEIARVLEDYRETVDKFLDKNIMPSEKTLPNKLHEAMRYSVFAGGKRIRPIIAMLTCKMFSGNMEDVLPVAAAIELIHTYSLIHDDLPAMDDDDMRRGKPSCHKVYGEAIAILAGDALLTKAFEVLSRAPKTTGIRPDVANLILESLAQGAGSIGMAGGQAMDILSTTTVKTEKKINEILLYEIHKRKTAALIAASARAGAFVAGAGISDINVVDDFGNGLGLLFQISDDILDCTTTSEKLGKTPGKDKDKNKLTFVSLFGIEAATKKLREFQAKTRSFIACYGDRARLLTELTDYIATRGN
ncbi:MAG TPA: polyprenyl synthetase family protein [Candidatus Wallbacteria bacterium]|nr:polyprenyl synthetase family protein [Candidatus Wallbacteria bacterium]